MSATLEMMVPTGWQVVEPGEGPRSAEAVADSLVSHLPASERGPWRDTILAGFEAGFRALEGSPGELLSVLVPGGETGAVLPLSVAVVRLDLATESTAEANSVLAGIVRRDPTARLLATDAGPALRTHTRAPLDSARVEALGLPEGSMPEGSMPEGETLRARYLLPPRGRGRWLALLHTVPLVDDGAVNAWLELCDALVLGARWTRDE